MRMTARPLVTLLAVVSMTTVLACGGGKTLKLVVERETVIHDPIIRSVSIDGPARLDTREQGQTVSVRLTGDPGLTATFDVKGMFEGRAMTEGPAGVYTGSFDVGQGATGSVEVTGHLLHPPTGASAAADASAALSLYRSEEPRDTCEDFDAKIRPLTIEFSVDSSEIPEDAAKRVQDSAALLASHPECKVFVIGHTDHTGAEQYNVVLSALRAINVGRLLESAGVDQMRIEKHPMGTRFPLNEGGSEDLEAKNRRVEIRAVYPYR